MSLLLDTHILLALLDGSKNARADAAVRSSERLWISTASLWEIAIKVRLGKLPLKVPLADLNLLLGVLGVSVLSISEHHAVTELDVEPATRDPFDRMLLAQCQVENLRLVTQDRALASHPLAWSAAE